MPAKLLPGIPVTPAKPAGVKVLPEDFIANIIFAVIAIVLLLYFVAF